MQSVTTIVFAHGDVLKTVYRHLPIWKMSTNNLLIVSPKDNQVFIPDADCLSIEKREHHGVHALARILFTMQTALAYNSDVYVFLEYDALMLRRPVARTSVQGNIYNFQVVLNRQEFEMSTGKCFMHFPWIFPADSLKEFVDRVRLTPTDNAPHDIWVIQKLYKLNMPVFNLQNFSKANPNGLGEGFSVNSVDTPERLLNLEHHVKNGAYALHGIKTSEALKKVLSAVEEPLCDDVWPA